MMDLLNMSGIIGIFYGLFILGSTLNVRYKTIKRLEQKVMLLETLQSYGVPPHLHNFLDEEE